MGREREGSTPAELREEVGVLVALTRALRRTRLVTVAEVQGDAAGFGVGVIAACNVAVAVESARFSFPEVTIGLAPALVLAWLPRVVGEREAFWLTASGEAIPARRAQELGLLNGVVPTAEELAKDVDDRIGVLRSHSPRVHADIKDMLRLFAGASDDDALTSASTGWSSARCAGVSSSTVPAARRRLPSPRPPGGRPGLRARPGRGGAA